MSEVQKFKPALTVFMLTKTTRHWLDMPVPQRFEWFKEKLSPILKKHAGGVSMRFFDTEFYTARVTDVFVWDATDHHSYQMLVEELRETAMWDHYFTIVELLAGVENAYAKHYDRAPVAA